ncbi:MAG: hypothetical protein OXI56_06215, partial [bacterium]|nr:hypothetical protein [bacterium]
AMLFYETACDKPNRENPMVSQVKRSIMEHYETSWIWGRCFDSVNAHLAQSAIYFKSVGDLGR